jgi:hypothetical protein
VRWDLLRVLLLVILAEIPALDGIGDTLNAVVVEMDTTHHGHLP